MAQETAVSPATQEQRLSMSYEEFLAWSEEDTHAEWVNGEVIIFMPPRTAHQEIALFLAALLFFYTRSLNLGRVIAAPFEMRVLPGRSSREPDILFVAREHEERLTADRLEGPADLVIELVSDSSVSRDRADKFYEYQEAGVREYLIIDPRPGKQRVDFYHLDARGMYEARLPDAEGHYHSTVVSGFWFDPDWLWQDPLPDPLSVLLLIAPQAQGRQLKSPDSAGS